MVKELREEAKEVVEKSLNKMWREMVDEIGPLLFKPSSAVRSLFPEEMWGGDEVLLAELHTTFTFKAF